MVALSIELTDCLLSGLQQQDPWPVVLPTRAFTVYPNAFVILLVIYDTDKLADSISDNYGNSEMRCEVMSCLPSRAWVLAPLNWLWSVHTVTNPKRAAKNRRNDFTASFLLFDVSLTPIYSIGIYMYIKNHQHHIAKC